MRTASQLLLRVLPLWLLLATATQAQQPSLAAFPDCAQECIGSALLGGLCLPTNQTCICSDVAFQTNVTLCVTESCTIPESLATRNATLTSCGAPVRDHSGKLITISNVLVSISGGFIVARFIYKVFVAHLDLGLDDWCILVTGIASIPSACITVYGTVPNGLGKDIWTLAPHQITNVIFYFYMMAWLYFIQAALIKLSFVSFFLKIFPAKDVQRLLWATFGFITLWGLVFVLTSIFQCRPVSYFWTQWDGMHKGSCSSANLVSWIHAGVSIVLDLWILGIPLWQLRKLQLHWKKKIGVALMLCVGTFVTVVSILRLQSLVTFAATSNSTWEFFGVSMWSTIEICVGIMCANLPAVRMLLVKVFPVLGGSSQRSKQAGYTDYGRGRYDPSMSNKTARSGSRHNTVHVTSMNSPTESNDDATESNMGITYQKSYQVQYSDHDEASLVPMNDLDLPKTWPAPGRTL